MSADPFITCSYDQNVYFYVLQSCKCISFHLHNRSSHISSCFGTSDTNCQNDFVSAVCVRSRPLITLLPLFTCSPSSPYQRPSFLIQHGSVVTATHEYPGIPPHLLFKSMQITTSKSSGASAETELCRYGDWTSKKGWGRACMYAAAHRSHL